MNLLIQTWNFKENDYKIGKILFLGILFNIILCFTTSPSYTAGLYYGIATSIIAKKLGKPNINNLNKDENKKIVPININYLE